MNSQDILQTIVVWPLITLTLVILVAVIFRKKLGALIRQPKQFGLDSHSDKSQRVFDGVVKNGRRKPDSSINDIFISYKREEQAIARKLANALEGEGWTVWWDPKLRAGERFNDVIEKVLNEAKCVIVLWSKRSVESLYVKDEAHHALKRDKLVPVMIEEVKLPFRFEDLHTPSLLDWDGSHDAPGFRRLVEDIATVVGHPVTERRKGQPAGRKQLVEDQSPVAALLFNPSSAKHVQRGNVMGTIGGIDQPCDEYKYAIGVVNLSSKPIVCQLVLEHSDPHDTSIQRLELPLRVRGQLREGDGKFTLPPGNNQPTVYVEVLQEIVLKSNPLNEHAIIKLIYANSADGRANWFQDHRDHVLTFRLQGDMPKPVTIKLSVRSENLRYAVRHLA